jgi:hypothetical protein
MNSSMEGEESMNSPSNDDPSPKNLLEDSANTPEVPDQHALELELISKLRLAFGSALHMLESARDNLVVLGNRMDRLQDKSRQCREALGVVKPGEETPAQAEDGDDDVSMS